MRHIAMKLSQVNVDSNLNQYEAQPDWFAKLGVFLQELCIECVHLLKDRETLDVIETQLSISLDRMITQIDKQIALSFAKGEDIQGQINTLNTLIQGKLTSKENIRTAKLVIQRIVETIQKLVEAIKQAKKYAEKK